jgi:ketosteroid isomerase-like protein
MSQENVAIVERLVAAVNAREQVPDGLLATDFRSESVSTAVTDKTYYGLEGVREWTTDMFEAFEDGAQYETEEILAHGESYVVARVHLAGRGAASGAPLLLRWINVGWFTDGKLSRAAGYANKRDALAAVGLPE